MKKGEELKEQICKAIDELESTVKTTTSMVSKYTELESQIQKEMKKDSSDLEMQQSFQPYLNKLATTIVSLNTAASTGKTTLLTAKPICSAKPTLWLDSIRKIFVYSDFALIPKSHHTPKRPSQ